MRVVNKIKDNCTVNPSILMATIGKDIEEAKRLLSSGKLVGIPTETVYGLAGNALDEKSIISIYKVKNRPKFDPLIAHTDDLNKIQDYVNHVPEKALKLATTFWPGPLTLLLKKKPNVPDLLTSGLAEIAIRMPRHELTLKLLSSLDFPLAAPSANPFGYVSPVTAQHVQDQLGDKIPYILDGGTCEVGIESTIVGFDEQENPVIYRLGGKKLEDIEAVVGRVRLRINQSSNPSAPGMLKSHYAPGKKVIIGELENLIRQYKNRKIGIISFGTEYADVPTANQVILSKTHNLDEAAAHLFSALRELDHKDVDYILSERFPDEGLGKAINDRLKRASS